LDYLVIKNVYVETKAGVLIQSCFTALHLALNYTKLRGCL